MIKFIITAVIVYFLIRWIAYKPWQNSQIVDNQKTRVDHQQTEPKKTFDDGDFVDYEEID